MSWVGQLSGELRRNGSVYQNFDANSAVFEEARLAGIVPQNPPPQQSPQNSAQGNFLKSFNYSQEPLMFRPAFSKQNKRDKLSMFPV